MYNDIWIGNPAELALMLSLSLSLCVHRIRFSRYFIIRVHSSSARTRLLYSSFFPDYIYIYTRHANHLGWGPRWFLFFSLPLIDFTADTFLNEYIVSLPCRAHCDLMELKAQINCVVQIHINNTRIHRVRKEFPVVICCTYTYIYMYKI